ncbi:class I adenylate-forming enzyme family protein [Metabacillus malikii]|uniref:Acyl-coenzyme A synthetase/AMP-(Fatty) acid ligase n=1 Tax=Metabacillus malikii TaxID=1504265 RepID=A0ABT9ZCT0_9BACI|nr:class I adenylate-forming enzyme family protein [Metabacillus malikii]MDQ0229070.1 acyl-coenzyme A synthetase/AMP-(fatty) acid ligase [Metabacillus malikii]
MSIFFTHLKLNSRFIPNRTALLHHEQSISYSELFQTTLSINHYLYHKYAKKKQDFIVYLENGNELAQLFIALDFLQVNMTIIHRDTALENIIELFKVDESKVLLTSARLLKEIEAYLHRDVVVEVVEKIDAQEITSENRLQITTNPCHIIFYTSGTSGQPKGALFNKNIFHAGVWSQHEEVHKVYLNTRPLYFKAHFSLFALYMQTGQTLILQSDCEQFNADVCLKQIEKYKATHIMLSPHELQLLLTFLKCERKKLPSEVKEVCCLGSSVPKKVVESFHKQLSCKLTTIYGTTETGIISCNQDLQLSNVSSVGKPFLGVEVKIVDENDEAIDVLTRGEICIKTSGMIEDYVDNQDLKPMNMWRDYFRTGDIGYVDEQQQLHIISRKNGLVNINGNHFAISGLEDVIRELTVVEGCFAHIERTATDVSIVLFVQLIEHAFPDEVKEIVTNYITYKLPKYMHPKEIIIVKELKANYAGKMSVERMKDLRSLV